MARWRPASGVRPGLLVGGGALIVALLVGGSVLGGWLIVRSISHGVCSSYNFVSNDLCDEWRLDPPPAERFPLPSGWAIASDRLDCGSGGCPTRIVTVSAQDEVRDPVRSHVRGLRRMGWEVERRSGSGGGSREGRRGELVVVIRSADRNTVEVGFFLEGEALAYE